LSTENKKYCPHCSIVGSSKIEMIRPRADLLGFGTKKAKIHGSDHEFDVISNDVPIGDQPFMTWTDDNKREIKYFDYMCPECNLVLFYGEKNF